VCPAAKFLARLQRNGSYSARTGINLVQRAIGERPDLNDIYSFLVAKE
jgi:hypothetical protein